MKILALYLPQFHETDENNLWWGKGHTEWNSVKNAVPLYKSHYQPRVPLNEYYYDLSKSSGETWKWQSELANTYGVYGFCVYHYWFKGKKILNRPLEILLDHPEINIKYCMSWANETWKRTWYSGNNDTLIQQDYGNEENWAEHVRYLLCFFKDDRYIKIDNKPVFCIYNTSDIVQLKEIINVWNKLLKNEGFDGIYVISGKTGFTIDERTDLFDAYYHFEPGYTLVHKLNHLDNFHRFMGRYKRKLINKIISNSGFYKSDSIELIYEKIIIEKDDKVKNYYGLFPSWDNTPRKGDRGYLFYNSSPKKFKEKLKKMCEFIGEDEFVFINAWNEWGEGAYLEPDTIYGYQWLNSIKEVVDESK